MTESVLAPGTIVAQRLQIVRVLGIGGMGAVYEVEHRLTRHRRALKLLHAEVVALPGVVDRFVREASAAGRIGNPHIVETFDAGTTEQGEPYLVMELLKGKPLSSRLEQRGKLGPDEALEIFTQVCDGVQAAHDSGIVHRDLKPENIFLVAGPRVFVKLLDFGISKFDPATTGTPQTTVEGSMLGTPYYMSPEQVRGARDIDASADVYALGVVLYECLVGKRPFDAETLTHLAILINEGKYVKASELSPELPREIDDVIQKALAPDRHARFRSALELAQAVEAVLGRAVLGGMRTEISMPSVLPGAYSSAPQAPSLAPTPPSVVPTVNRRAMAGTPAPVETTPRPSRSLSRAVIGGALIIVAAAGAIVFSVMKATSLTPEVPSSKASSPPPTPHVEASRPAARPEVTVEPVDPGRIAPVAPSASASAGAPRLTAQPAHAPSRPSTGPPAGSARRSTEHGLVETNPFQ